MIHGFVHVLDIDPGGVVLFARHAANTKVVALLTGSYMLHLREDTFSRAHHYL